jgi:Nuclease subunit of the excinuclease complex
MHNGEPNIDSFVLKTIDDELPILKEYVSALFSRQKVLIGKATLSTKSGVYAFYYEDTLMYIGEAKGNGGLKDRVLSKHVSGDGRHTLQKAFLKRFPDRTQRREFIKQNIYVQWIEIECKESVPLVERLLIWSLRPKWNLK